MHSSMKVGLHATLAFKIAMAILNAAIIKGVKLCFSVMKVVDTQCRLAILNKLIIEQVKCAIGTPCPLTMPNGYYLGGEMHIYAKW